MKNKKINIIEKLKRFNDYWSPKVIAEMNDYQIKLAKISGEFIWHCHESTDEVFFVIDGQMTIEFRNGIVELSEGEMIVVKKGEQHKPFASEECNVLIVEPRGVVNTGDSGGKLTAENDIWI